MSARILHIDSSGPKALVMLAEQGKPLSWEISDAERDHAEKLAFLVEKVMASADCRLPQLDAIAVCSGPGSYTGLRIGMAAAKGYCYALGKPLLLHNRLKLMLQELKEMPEARSGNRLAILPARTGEYFIALDGEQSIAPRHVMSNELLDITHSLSRPFDAIGHAFPELEALNLSYLGRHESLDMAVWARLSSERFAAGNFADLAYSEPEYLKPAYVTASRKEK